MGALDPLLLRYALVGESAHGEDKVKALADAVVDGDALQVAALAAEGLAALDLEVVLAYLGVDLLTLFVEEELALLG